MQFHEIHFYEREGYGVGRHVRGCWVGKSSLEIMWQHASIAISQLNLSEQQTTETLFGKTEWRDVEFKRRLSLGRCLRFFVDNNMLPIKIANEGKKGKRKYLQK